MKKSAAWVMGTLATYQKKIDDLKQNVKNPVVLLPGIHNLWENDHVESIQEGVHEGK